MHFSRTWDQTENTLWDLATFTFYQGVESYTEKRRNFRIPCSLKPSLSTTSKSLSNNQSSQNKCLCFCCLQDKTWIKMPKWTIFDTSVYVFVTEITYLTKIWRNNWWSIIDIVENLCYMHLSLAQNSTSVSDRNTVYHQTNKVRQQRLNKM